MADVTEIVQNSQNTDRDFYMFCFSESRLNDHIDDKEVSIAGFHMIRKDPIDRKETDFIVYISMRMSFFFLTPYPVRRIQYRMRVSRSENEEIFSHPCRRFIS